MNTNHIKELQDKVALAKAAMHEAQGRHTMFAGTDLMAFALAEDAYSAAVKELKEAESFLYSAKWAQ